ncbi:four helix bundle protein [Fibrella forsythiae]|uniref:four helix bundle protein n=1 Tax=Fibrella forsythiae TaxID=2817061 RepID=UPI00286E19F0|nr:four helix bundle protein [Fibrella forsythiae]
MKPLAKQILRSGTSIGANVEEALGGYSKKDFVTKIGISLKEARETHYWLKLLHATGYLEQTAFDSICYDCQELIKMLGAIKITTQRNIAEELNKLKGRRLQNS